MIILEKNPLSHFPPPSPPLFSHRFSHPSFQHPDPDWEGQADSYPSPAPDRRDMHRQSSSSSSIPHASSNSSKYHYTSSRNIPSTQHDSGDIPGRGGERRPTRSNRYKSWDASRLGRESFSAYTQLITTPGFGAHRRHLSFSSEELR